MFVFKLCYVLFLTASCQAIGIGDLLSYVDNVIGSKVVLPTFGDVLFYLNNLLESRAALPNLEEDFIIANADTLQFLSRNTDTYNFEDAYLNVSQLVNKYGFPFEEHRVTTEDGYILTLHRIPSNGPVVLLNHGILLSSVDWITAGPKGSPAYYLASRGYDVWLANARGNRYSKRHVYLSPKDQRRFFDFTFHEIGLYDLPASVDYILRLTREEKLNYVGYSQGTTAFFVLNSLRPEYNDKFKVSIALSPVTWFSHLFSPVLRLAYKVKLFQILMAIGQYDFLSSPVGLYTFCNNNNIFKFICIFGQYLTFGFDRGMFNYTNLPVVTSHVFAGCSTKQFDHYGQVVYSGRFRPYDFGETENLKRYGMKTPPDYPVNRVTAPVALSYSFSDFFSSVVDVLQLRKNLPNVVGFFEARSYNHIDYNFARDLDKKINKVIVEYIERFSNN